MYKLCPLDAVQHIRMKRTKLNFAIITDFGNSCTTLITVFIRIVAVATINFSLAGVRQLIEDGSYSRMAFVYFGGIPLRRVGGILL